MPVAPTGSPSGLFSDVAPIRDATKGIESRTSRPGNPGTGTKDPETPDATAAGSEVKNGAGAGEVKPTDDGAPAGSTGAEPKAPSVPEQPSDPARDERPSTRSEDLELPELAVDALAADDEALRRAGVDGIADPHPVAGVWRQVGGPTDSDFGPGGYDRSILMLNPSTRVAAVYRSFRGSLAVVMGGELALDAPRDPARPLAGAIELRADPSLSSRFPASRVPLGGSPPRYVEPPAGASPWRIEWTRQGDRLVLGGRVYEPAGIDEFEAIRRGGADAATAEERAERSIAAGPGSAAGAASAAAQARPRPKQTSFFGVVGGGNRFVYVVDVSGSMAGPKLDRLKAELEKSVAMLPDDAEFSIVFFASGAQVIDQGWMLAKRDRQRAIDAIRAQGCDGGTDPTSALDFAFTTLSPLPDCVFLMTDGLMSPGVADHVRALNAGRVKTVFHTIGFGEAGAEPVLRQIADENVGTYTFVAP